MSAFLADLLTVAGVVMAYIGVGVVASIVVTAGWMKWQEVRRGR